MEALTSDLGPTPLSYLIAALVAPAAGPALYGLLHDRPKAVSLVDGSVYAAVPALLAWQVAHLAIEQSTLFVLSAAAAGIAVPSVAEGVSRALHRRTDQLALLMGVSGLALHALLEGAALVPGEGGIAFAFGLAIVLHRIPVGLVIWWLVRPRYGAAIGVLGVGSIVVVTLAGYALGTEVVEGVHGGWSDLYQAFVSGSLVHVVFHQGRRDHTHE